MTWPPCVGSRSSRMPLRMTPSIAQALIRWCEGNTALRSPGVTLKCVASPDTPCSSAYVEVETANMVWRVTVWDHNGMCDVEQLDLSGAGKLKYQHREQLDSAQVVSLMDDLVMRAQSI